MKAGVFCKAGSRRTHELTRNSPTLPPEPRRVGDDGAEIDVVGEAVERTAEGDQRARVSGTTAFSGSSMTALGWGSSRPDFQEGGELDSCGLADGAPEQRALGSRIETIAVLQDVGNEAPGARASKGGLPRLGVELMQELWPELDEENYLGRDSVDHSPAAPVRRIDADLQVNEARCERCRHAVGDAAIAFAVAAGDQRRAFGQLVLAAFAVEHQLIEGGLDHGQGGGQLFQVDEPAARIVRWRQEGGRRPSGAVGAVTPGDAAQADGIEQQRADADVFAAGGGRDLLGDVPIWRCRAGPKQQPVGGPPPARPGCRQARSVAACSRRRWCRGRSLGAPDECKSRAERLPDAPILAPFPAWLSSSPCQGTSLPNGSSAPRVAGVLYLRRGAVFGKRRARLSGGSRNAIARG